jgi:hypothetical protein
MNRVSEIYELKTNLVNYKVYITCFYLLFIFGFLVFASFAVADSDSRWIANRKIDNHMVFKYFSKNRFIVHNYDALRRVGTVTFFFSLAAGFIVFYISQRSFNLGFFKINISRVNINGEIFQWHEIASLKFTINSPKTYGERSARQGFQNWIEFMVNGKLHKHEFYLENMVMEDELLKLLEEIKKHSIPEIKIIETRKLWFVKLAEELGIDSQ